MQGYDFDGIMRVSKGQLADIGEEGNSTKEERQRDFLASVGFRAQSMPMAHDGGLQLTERDCDNVVK